MAGWAFGARPLPTALGVQLYTLRTVLADDPAGTLEAVAAIGYEEVERAGLLGAGLADTRRLLSGAGLRAASSHEAVEAILDGPALEHASVLGQRGVVVPWIAEAYRTPDGYRRLADQMNRAGEAAAAAGLGLAYHNHDFEFTTLDGGETGFGLLLARCDPDLVSFQLDLFWAVHAGADPAALFAAHPGRFSSVHVKDRTADGTMVDVGQGAIDFVGILRGADRAGVAHLFVEHDQPADPLASVRTSHRALTRIVRAVSGAPTRA